MSKRWFEVGGWFNFADVYDRAVDLFPSGSHFVEVGSWKGRSALYMAERIEASGKEIRFDCVDTWAGSKEHLAAGVDCSGLFAEFMENTAGSGINVRRGRSWDIAATYAHESLDFVFLDGSHEEPDVFGDIATWSLRLKPTGVLAGDDITEFPGVRAALLRHGFGTEKRPIVLGGSAQPAWIVPPVGEEWRWRTPKA